MNKLFLEMLIIIAASTRGNLATYLETEKYSDSKSLIIIGGETFYFGIGIPDYVTWFTAEMKCQEIGMQLVTLDTEERWTMISDWIIAHPDFDKWWWSSGFKPASQPTFMWSTTGQNFTFSDWNEGEPSRDPDVQSCVNFRAGIGGWDDDECDSFRLMYICENVPERISKSGQK